MKETQTLIQTISMRLISMARVLLLVSVLFAPAVAASSMEQAISEIPIEKVSSSESVNDYIVYADESKPSAK